MKLFNMLLSLSVVVLMGIVVMADDNVGKPQRSSPSIKPANIPDIPFRTVSGSVTVRLNGALVDPDAIDYIFAPDFPANSGSLERTNYGNYFLRADNVPEDRPYTLSISAHYDDSIKGRDGYIERRGKIYSGLVRIDIPHGRDVDIGVRFLDLR